MKNFVLIGFVLLFIFSCKKQKTLFELVSVDHSSIDFSNTIVESDSIHYFNFPYIYTGAGVGVADFDNDGLQDIFFSGNMVSSRLYLNKGNFVFKDISESAGIKSNQWATGVSIVDINQDGWKDIYLCVGGYDENNRKNRLFINNGPSPGQLTFTEAAESYGIADEGMSTQAAFFDYDLDGDLDLYLMQHANEPYAMISKLETFTDGRGPSTDRLYENIGVNSVGQPSYENVSGKAGITIEGYGLGLAISDINRDGWPDIYVANDYIGSDLLYINNQDGTFSNTLGSYLNQCSRNGMGVDIADINNDALSDIFVLDMLPEDNYRQKMMTAQMNYEHFKSTLQKGFAPQFIRNTLQINRGIGPSGDYSFSEIGRLAGLHQTDWSWSPLITDFDNDGLKDIYITNGFRRDVTNQDFVEYTDQKNLFVKGELSEANLVKRLTDLDSVCLSNYMFRNEGSLEFENKTSDWGMDHETMSNGSAYADFDNDGDLDLVVNNINAPASLYKNNTDRLKKANKSVAIRLKGKPGNFEALGAKVHLTLPDGSKRYYENYTVRGYMSSSENKIHVGLGSHSKIDSLLIVWPDGKQSIHTEIAAGTTAELDYSDITFTSEPLKTLKTNTTLFEEVSSQLNLNYRHQENTPNDFRHEPLLLQQYDNNGPGIAVGDINGDNQADFYVGGGRNQSGTLFIQTPEDTFNSKSIDGSEFYEDMGTLLFDADQDGDLDLYVVSGGSSVKYFNKGHYQDRLYFNDGNGNFELDEDALPTIASSGSCVIAADFDNDGDLDLFVGGRVVPGKFPTNPEHYLLENREGKFYDSTKKLASELHETGMITAALWSDFDNDQDFDLIVVGEWMPITVFENKNGTFTKIQTDNGLQSYKGWWNSIVGGDFDSDGDIDYVAGNLGKNTFLKTGEERPIRLYVQDFDGNASLDPIITRYINGKEYPVAPRRSLIDQLEVINRAFPSYEAYAKADIKKILEAFNPEKRLTLETNYFKSAYIENLGNGKFSLKALPVEAQYSTVHGMEVGDFDGDGFTDIVGVGNNSQTEVISGWYNAQKGFYLKGDGNGNFESIKSNKTGFFIEGDTRALGSWHTEKSLFLITSVNTDSLRVFKSDFKDKVSLYRLQPNDVSGEIHYQNGKKRKFERYWGHGYLSQSDNTLLLSPNMTSIIIYNTSGKKKTIDLNGKEVVLLP